MKDILQKVIWFSITLVFIFAASKISAQPAGAPFFTDSHKQFTVGLDAGKYTSTIYGVENNSKRILLKGVYGLGSRLDLFALVGGVALKLSDSSGITLDDNYNIAYGIGFRLALIKFGQSGFSLLGGAQIIRFRSNPSSDEPLNVANSQVTRSVAMKYDWREANADAGLAKNIGRFCFYTGVNLKYIDREETKIEEFSFGESSLPTNIQNGRYQSGVLMSPVFGLDIKVGSYYQLHGEISGTDKTDYAFYFGISQAGSP
jgi:hypothetical protein